MKYMKGEKYYSFSYTDQFACFLFPVSLPSANFPDTCSRPPQIVVIYLHNLDSHWYTYTHITCLFWWIVFHYCYSHAISISCHKCMKRIILLIHWSISLILLYVINIQAKDIDLTMVGLRAEGKPSFLKSLTCLFWQSLLELRSMFIGGNERITRYFYDWLFHYMKNKGNELL